MFKDLRSVSIQVTNFDGTESRDMKNLYLLNAHIKKRLTYQAYVDNIVKKCMGMLTVHIHAKHVITHSLLKHIINALVVSLVRYCISI